MPHLFNRHTRQTLNIQDKPYTHKTNNKTYKTNNRYTIQTIDTQDKQDKQ